MTIMMFMVMVTDSDVDEYENGWQKMSIYHVRKHMQTKQMKQPEDITSIRNKHHFPWKIKI